MQFYKGDEQEIKFYNSGAGAMDSMELSIDAFFEEAFSCFVLGDLIWDSGRSPLSNAIPKEVFREAFPVIFETFLEAGSLEGYLTIFRNIFGDTVDVTFTIPAPGKLLIDIVAAGVVINNLVSRYIINNQYAFDELITQDGLDELVVQSVKGMESEYEVEQMLFELVPSGIYTQISLTIG